MFNLDKSIVLWKNEFYKNDSFTNDDIEELEGHLLDKIDSLIKIGLSEEEAFLKAKDNIGTAEVLHYDFSIVNKMEIVSKRIVLGLFGYVFIVFLNNIIRLLTTFISLPFATSLVNKPVSKHSIVGSIMHFMYGNNANALNGLSFTISSLFVIGLIYFLTSNKFNIINVISNYVNNIIASKSYLAIRKVISSMVILTFFIIGTPIVRTIMQKSIQANEVGNIYFGIDGSRFIFEFILVIMFIYRVNSKVRYNKNVLFTLGGYLIGNILITTIPIIVCSVILRISAQGLVFKAIYFGGYLLITGIIIFMITGINSKFVAKSNNKINLLRDKSLKTKVSFGTFISIIYLGITLYIPTMYIYIIYRNNINNRISEVLSMAYVMQIFIIILAQVIVSIVLIKRIKAKRKIV